MAEGLRVEKVDFKNTDRRFVLAASYGDRSKLIVDVEDVSTPRRLGIVREFRPEFQRQGIGTLLMKAMVIALQECEVAELRSKSCSVAALSLRCKLFDDKVLTYHDFEAGMRGMNLAMSTEQAISSMQLYMRNWVDGKTEEQLGIGCSIEISEVDTSEWNAYLRANSVF